MRAADGSPAIPKGSWVDGAVLRREMRRDGAKVRDWSARRNHIFLLAGAGIGKFKTNWLSDVKRAGIARELQPNFDITGICGGRLRRARGKEQEPQCECYFHAIETIDAGRDTAAMQIVPEEAGMQLARLRRAPGNAGWLRAGGRVLF